MADLRPSITLPFAVFGVAATVTVPGSAAVQTTAIWLTPMAVETNGVLAPTNSPQPVLALQRSAVPSAPRGTLISAPETEGGTVKAWIVEAVLGETAEEIRVLVITGD